MMLLMALGTLFVGFFVSFSFSAAGSRLVVAQGTKWGAAVASISAIGAGKLTGAGYEGAGSLARKVPGAAGLANLAGKIPGTTGAYNYTKKGVQKGYKEALPISKRVLDQMAKVKGKGIVMEGIGPTGAAMGAGMPGLKADFSYTVTGLSVKFADKSRDPGPSIITNWKWTFGEVSGAATGKDQSYDYKKSGSYSVTLTVTNSYRKTASVTKNISVSGGGGTAGGGTVGGTGGSTPSAPQPPPPPPAGGSIDSKSGLWIPNPRHLRTPQSQGFAPLPQPSTTPPTAPLLKPKTPKPQPAQPTPTTTGGGTSGSSSNPLPPNQMTTDTMIRLLTSIAMSTHRAAVGTEEEREERKKSMRQILDNIKPSDVKVIVNNNAAAAETLRQGLKETLSDEVSTRRFVQNNGGFAQHLVSSPNKELYLSVLESHALTSALKRKA